MGYFFEIGGDCCLMDSLGLSGCIFLTPIDRDESIKAGDGIRETVSMMDIWYFNIYFIILFSNRGQGKLNNTSHEYTTIKYQHVEWRNPI